MFLNKNNIVDLDAESFKVKYSKRNSYSLIIILILLAIAAFAAIAIKFGFSSKSIELVGCIAIVILVPFIIISNEHEKKMFKSFIVQKAFSNVYNDFHFDYKNHLDINELTGVNIVRKGNDNKGNCYVKAGNIEFSNILTEERKTRHRGSHTSHSYSKHFDGYVIKQKLKCNVDGVLRIAKFYELADLVCLDNWPEKSDYEIEIDCSDYFSFQKHWLFRIFTSDYKTLEILNDKTISNLIKELYSTCPEFSIVIWDDYLYIAVINYNDNRGQNYFEKRVYDSDLDIEGLVNSVSKVITISEKMFDRLNLFKYSK